MLLDIDDNQSENEYDLLQYTYVFAGFLLYKLCYYFCNFAYLYSVEHVYTTMIIDPLDLYEDLGSFEFFLYFFNNYYIYLILIGVVLLLLMIGLVNILMNLHIEYISLYENKKKNKKL